MSNIIRNLLLAATIAVGAISAAQSAHAFGFDVDGFSIELGDVGDFGDFEDFEDAEDFADEVEIEIEIDDE
jgi:hypothetical protein